MINFRYHIISITAVFLALGLGLALGTSFGNRALLDSLRGTQGRLSTEVREKRATNAKLEAAANQRRERDDQFVDDAVKSPLMQGRLDQVPVLMVAPAGIDQKVLDRLRSALTASGARFAGILRLDKRLALEGDNLVKMAQLLHSSSTSPAPVRRELVRQLSAVLLQGTQPSGLPPPTSTPSTSSTTSPTGSSTTVASAPGPTSKPTVSTTIAAGGAESPSSTEAQLITDLRSEGFVTFEPSENGDKSDPLALDGDFRYLFVSEPGVDLADSALVIPLLRQMADRGDVPAVLASAALGAEPDASREAVVGPVRTDDVMAGRISTVDDLENIDGIAATVLALAEVSDGRHGHYGWGAKATAALPPVPKGP